MTETHNTKVAPEDAEARLRRLLENPSVWEKQRPFLEEGLAEAEAEIRWKAAQFRQKRLAEIPERYREPFEHTLSKLSPKAIEGISRWSPEAKLAIGLSGVTGIGKTRAMCSLLMRLRCTWLYLPASKFAQAVTHQWSRDHNRVSEAAKELLRAAKSVRVLLLDDLGDETHSESVTSHLKDLVEYRTSHKLHTHWTSNLSPDQITAKHGERGAAIVRRLAEFTWTPGI